MAPTIKIPEALIDHRKFFEIVDYLQEDDLLVFNDTRVIPARFYGEKETGGKFEVLLERILVANQLLVQIKSSKPPKENSRLCFYKKGTEEIDESLYVSVLDRGEGFFRLQVDPVIDLTEKFFIHGHVPLPPYIKRSDEHRDHDRYQTVYAHMKNFAKGIFNAAKSFFWMYSTSSIAEVFWPPAKLSILVPVSPPRTGIK